MIFIESEPDQTFPTDLLERAARAALDLSGVPDADLTIALVDDVRIQALSRDFLAHDAPTDVLSFPADEPDPETGRRYLGDVVISLARAEQQARERGHALESEMQLLVVHGVLHLLGHDHAEAGEKARMWAAQAEALERLGVSPNIVHE
ncbi:MAG TPA: rRNA maturation RNase YbeY [Anaerolineales bacterium]|nr:rRNA maturation RNase YbeY [Anaerolineales bacterium]